MSELLEVLEGHRARLQQTFQEHDVVLAYLFGSEARGDAGPLSDVDVAVLFDQDVPRDEQFNRVLHLMGELGGVLGRDDVYVANLADASPLLAHRVYLNGKLLFCFDDSERVRFQTRALREYVDTEPLRRIKLKYVLQRFQQAREDRHG
jgi:uncharacterized protein